MASVGGNLMQRTRCLYFYDVATPCNKREPGSGCSAINGFNRMHAILGTSDACIATHPSDMCVALAALDAQVHVTGPAGDRVMAFTDFHRLPMDTPQRDTNFEPNELITAVELPAQGFRAHYSYLKLRDRLSYAFALVSVAAALELEGDRIKQARLALGGVAHRPWRDRAAEDALRGQPATSESFGRAAQMLLRDARGFDFPPAHFRRVGDFAAERKARAGEIRAELVKRPGVVRRKTQFALEVGEREGIGRRERKNKISLAQHQAVHLPAQPQQRRKIHAQLHLARASAPGRRQFSPQPKRTLSQMRP